MEHRNPFTGETESEQRFDDLKWRFRFWVLGIGCALILAALVVVSFVASLSSYIFVGVIVMLAILFFVARKPERTAPRPMGHSVKTVVVADLATSTGLVETCGRLGGGSLLAPLSKLPAVWVHVLVDEPSSSDPPLVDLVLGEQLTIHDDTGSADVAMKGARVLVERAVVKTTEEDPAAVAELLSTIGSPVDPASRTLRVKERWLAPNERAWIRGHVQARMGDGYRSTTSVSLVDVTIALEPLLSHAEA